MPFLLDTPHETGVGCKITDFGKTIPEHEFKRALLKINSCIHFDVAGRMNWVHPQIATRQSVYWNNRFVAPMERGMLPEFNVWGVLTDSLGNKRRSHIVRVGWRHTLHTMIARGVPNLNWDNICLILGVRKKDFVGDQMEMDIKESGDLRMIS